MHFPSFDLRDPVLDVLGFPLSVQIATAENLYGLDPERLATRRDGNAVVVEARGLTWAGGSERAEGGARLCAVRDAAGRVRVELHARAPAPIRCTKLLVRGLAAPLVWEEEYAERAVGALGECLGWPNRIGVPLVCLRAGAERIGARAEDSRVREKRFAAAIERVGERAGAGVLELVHDAEATHPAPELDTPPWILARGARWPEILDAHLAFARGALGLVPWEQRADVPAWARELRLVLTLHGMHWTGRVLLDYAGMLDAIRFVAARVPGHHVLAYLAGFEGRYYWQYGDYRPEPRLGGRDGFRRLCDAARELGVHVMPMFGGNCANRTLPSVRALDPTANLKSATGNRFHGNQPDWDLSRAHDTGWQAWLNPGHPAWREALAGSIEALAREFGFDGVFLDTVHVWLNDPDYAVHDGIRALATRLYASLPGVLLAAEHDYDALVPLFPLFQRAWWGRDPAWTAGYARRFAHLCEGEPEGRTGVHEFGVWRTPGAPDPWQPAPGYLPTFAFQDGTLERSRARLEAALAAL